jgi:hypothetical protein
MEEVIGSIPIRSTNKIPLKSETYMCGFLSLCHWPDQCVWEGDRVPRMIALWGASGFNYGTHSLFLASAIKLHSR